MPKPRIVLADIDASYIVPLQEKFVEEYFDSIDLEVITDRTYFRQLFSAPQNIDVLVITEELYTPELQRHNIRQIFLLAEREREMEEDGINVLLKYTSLREVFSEIVAMSSLGAADGESKGPKIVLIYSAAGGMGKTTLALGLAGALAKRGKRVLYLNAGRLQTFQRVMKESAPLSEGQMYIAAVDAQERSPEELYQVVRSGIRQEGFSYLPPFKASLLSLGIPYQIFEKIAVGARDSGEYDIVIIDADTTFDESKIQLFGVAERVIMVTDQSRSGLYATNLLAGNISGIAHSEKYMFVCNRVTGAEEITMPDALTKFKVASLIEYIDACDTLGCEALAKIPSVQKLALLML